MAKIVTCDPQENFLLRALTLSEWEQLAPHLELVKMATAEVVYEAYEKLSHIYFPISATTSLLCCLEDGSTVEVAMVGNEGMLGISALMGGDESPTQVIVNQAGHLYRITINALQKVLARSGGRRSGMLPKLILRYAQTLFIQMSQATACNRRHAIDQQLCTWLLFNFDRGHTDAVSMTQESIAYILGVRRESITEAAKKLQEAGIIDYRRGHIELKDRVKMETRACECYGVIKGETHRLTAELEVA